MQQAISLSPEILTTLSQAQVATGCVFSVWVLVRLFFAQSMYKYARSYAFLSEMLSAFPLIKDSLTLFYGEIVDDGQNISYPDIVSPGLLFFSNFCEPARLIQLLKISKILALLNNVVFREGTELYSFAMVAILVLGSYYSFANDVDIYWFAEDGIMATQVFPPPCASHSTDARSAKSEELLDSTPDFRIMCMYLASSS